MFEGKPRLSLVACCLLISASAVLAAPTPVTFSGRKILVNGQPFAVQGVAYSPYPVGTTPAGNSTGCSGPYTWWSDPTTYGADFPLIKQMGANTIRAYGILNDTSANTVLQVRAALDAAAAQGLYVIMNYYPDHSLDSSAPANQTMWQNGFVAGINAYKDKSAVLIWEFGNEQNIDNGQYSGWYPFVNAVAGAAKTADTVHLVSTTEGECAVGCPNSPITFTIGSTAPTRLEDDGHMNNLDLWGVNVYRGASFQGLFQALVSSTTKPILVTEFGKDAWHDSIGAEDQAMQASHINSLWQEINSNLSVTGAGSQDLAGGVVFEWTDEWWKDPSNNCSEHGTQVKFTVPADTVDPNYQDEWFGLAAISPIDAVTNPAGAQRLLRTSYNTLQTFWNPAATVGKGANATSFFSDTVHNYPNPFHLGSGSTKFVVLANESGSVDIRIYDAGGQFVTSLTGSVTPPAPLDLTWDGHNSQGALVSSGLYVAKIHGHSSAHDETQYRKVVGVK
jgi:hypothetical protein